jgi:hypothetical protein
MKQKLKDYTSGKIHYTPTDEVTKQCFESLKKIVDLYREKFD